MENRNLAGKLTYSMLVCLLLQGTASISYADPPNHKGYGNRDNNRNSHQQFNDKNRDDWRQDKNSYLRNDKSATDKNRDNGSTRDYFKRKLYKEPDLDKNQNYKNNNVEYKRDVEKKYRRDEPYRKYTQTHERSPNNRTKTVVTAPDSRHGSSHHDHEYRGSRHDYRIYNRQRYVYYRTPWYNTFYLAPIRHHYHPFGHRVRYLPSAHIRLTVGSTPYFYASGVFYSYIGSDYVVVRAPIGAYIDVLPAGFVAFTLGLATYYYINDTYYSWDEARENYVVVEKPDGAEQAMEAETTGRLFIYPNKSQSEEQQAKDRYDCHRWAVNSSHVDPTEEDIQLTDQERSNYKRAISACLVAKDYTVK